MSSRLRFGGDELKAEAIKVKPPKGRVRKAADNNSKVDADNNVPSNADASPKPPDSKLKFSKWEQKIEKLERKASKQGKKHDKTRLPTKTVLKKERVYKEDTGKVKHKLSFEKEVIPINEAKWNKANKKSLPRKGIGLIKTAAVNKVHAKVHETEHENVGVHAAHQGELVGEGVWRGGKHVSQSAYRFVRNTPYRRASKLEVQSLKTERKLSYEKAVHENPKLKSNPISRSVQKRKIKKEYAAAIRSAKKSGKTATRAAGIVKKAGQAVAGLVRKNPILFVKAGVLLLLIFFIMALFSMCSVIFSGGSAFIGATSYAAGDRDIDNAEIIYTEWEADLQYQIDNAETDHPGYNEYRYNIGDIGHDAYELMAYLTAVYKDFEYTEILGVLREIFDEQYSLTFLEEVEVRYRINGYGEREPYNWNILNVTLETKPLSDVIADRMDTDQQEHYDLLMESKGNRQYVGSPFDFNWLPYVTCNYGWRIHPISGEKDFHTGVDIGVSPGTEIHAGFDGTVIRVDYDPAGYGNYVLLEDDKGIRARYAHCSSVLVSEGQTVKKGDVIATVGSTGNSTGPHLHLDVIQNGNYLNPRYFALTK